MPDIPDYMRDFDLNVDYGFTSVAKPPTKVVEKTDNKTAAVVEKTTSEVLLYTLNIKVSVLIPLYEIQNTSFILS